MSQQIILTAGDQVRVAHGTVDFYSQFPLDMDSQFPLELHEMDFTVVDFEGSYGSRKPVRVTLEDSMGNKYHVASSSISWLADHVNNQFFKV